MKLIIDIDEEEYKALSNFSEKEKVNALSYYERIIANGTPYEERPQGKWINSQVGQTCNLCKEIQFGYDSFRHFCPNCGAKMMKNVED